MAVGAVALTGTAALSTLDGVLPAVDRLGHTRVAGSDVPGVSAPSEAASSAVPVTQPTGVLPPPAPQETAEEEAASTRPTGAPTTGRKSSSGAGTGSTKSASKASKSASKSASKASKSATAAITTTTAAPTYTTPARGKGKKAPKQ